MNAKPRTTEHIVLVNPYCPCGALASRLGTAYIRENNRVAASVTAYHCRDCGCRFTRIDGGAFGSVTRP